MSTTTFPTPGEGAISTAFARSDKFKFTRSQLTASTEARFTAAIDAGGMETEPLLLLGATNAMLPRTNDDNSLVPRPAYICTLKPADPGHPTADELVTFMVDCNHVAVNPFKHPGPAAPAAAGGIGKQLYTTVKPTAFVLEKQFDPLTSSASVFKANCLEALDINDWSAQPDPKQVEQILNNVAAGARSALLLKGAREMAPTALLDHIAAKWPSSSNRATRLQAIHTRRCTNGEDAEAFAAQVTTDFLQVYDTKTLKQFDELTVDADTQRERYAHLGLILLDTAAPAAKDSMKMDHDALALACNDLAGLDAITTKLTTEWQRRAITSKRSTGSFPVLPAADVHALKNKIKELEAALQKAKAGTPSSPRKQPPSACRLCKDSPIAVDGGKPGMHWHSQCPKHRRNQGNEDDTD